MTKALFVIVILQCAALVFIYTLLVDVRDHAQALPAKIDMLVDASNDKPINLSCPECKDYTSDFSDLKKLLKKMNAPQGVYYYYTGGCR